MLKIVILAVVATLCLSQDLGDEEYIPCDKCRIPNGEFPKEGKMVCFKVKSVFKSMTRLNRECYEVKCEAWDIFCVPTTKCKTEKVTVLEPDCELERITTHKPIDEIPMEDNHTMYHIHTPRYYTHSSYPNNTYCVWNVANTGLVTYHIMNQQLQEPSDCDGPGCDCPDSVKITMGTNEVKLCGSTMPSMAYLISSNGLHVKFCSDNKGTAKGFFMGAYRFSDVTMQKRSTKKDVDSNTIELDEFDDNATCQYDYMMRVSQPDVPCPDEDTLVTMLQYHNRFMSASSQIDGMCSDMNIPTSMMPRMNKIEMCAVEYLYRTRDCKFAKKVANSSNKELCGVAHAILNNDFMKMPKWMNAGHKNCTNDDE